MRASAREVAVFIFIFSIRWLCESINSFWLATKRPPPRHHLSTQHNAEVLSSQGSERHRLQWCRDPDAHRFSVIHLLELWINANLPSVLGLLFSFAVEEYGKDNCDNEECGDSDNDCSDCSGCQQLWTAHIVGQGQRTVQVKVTVFGAHHTFHRAAIASTLPLGDVEMHGGSCEVDNGLCRHDLISTGLGPDVMQRWGALQRAAFQHHTVVFFVHTAQRMTGCLYDCQV
ncbi:uncharacterized protein LOC130917106 [Corythoichthys intestinalis]|uniref:uncharacterized protein LOC130917106 n=1 Tax=Corythoichthys intestinalis TaxID=161448 RepID=UPI0025A59986|nr:uncharacterized protein LOC130917106 [Corythoichthys intestinalis]